MIWCGIEIPEDQEELFKAIILKAHERFSENILPDLVESAMSFTLDYLANDGDLSEDKLSKDNMDLLVNFADAVITLVSGITLKPVFNEAEFKFHESLIKNMPKNPLNN